MLALTDASTSPAEEPEPGPPLPFTPSFPGPGPAGQCRLTVDVGLLVDLRDAQQIGSLLLAAAPRLPPGQGGLEVELVAAVGQVILVPEGLAVVACGD